MPCKYHEIPKSAEKINLLSKLISNMKTNIQSSFKYNKAIEAIMHLDGCASALCARLDFVTKSIMIKKTPAGQ